MTAIRSARPFAPEHTAGALPDSPFADILSWSSLAVPDMPCDLSKASTLSVHAAECSWELLADPP